MADVFTAQKWLLEELTEYDDTLYSTVYPEYWGAGGEIVPSTGDLKLGTRRFISGRIDMVGKATIYDGKATDIPLADFGITADEYRAIVVVLGAEWHLFDLESEDVANANGIFVERDLIDLKMEALNRGINQRFHEIVAFGVPQYEMSGFLNSSDVEIINSTVDLYTLNSNDLYDWFRELLTQIREETMLTAQMTELIVPIRLQDRLTQRFEQNADGTPFELLTSSAKGQKVRTIRELNELSSTFLERFGVHTSGTNKDRFMLLQRSPQTIRRKFYPIDRTDPILQDDGVSWRVTGFAGTTEVQVREPWRVRYVDFPKFNGQQVAA